MMVQEVEVAMHANGWYQGKHGSATSAGRGGWGEEEGDKEERRREQIATG